MTHPQSRSWGVFWRVSFHSRMAELTTGNAAFDAFFQSMMSFMGNLSDRMDELVI